MGEDPPSTRGSWKSLEDGFGGRVPLLQKLYAKADVSGLYTFLGWGAQSL